MSVAEKAVANAIPLEVKKDGLQQRQNGDWVLRFVVQAADMDQRLTNAAMGTRFMAALVEVGDNEEPKEKGKLDWRDVQPAAQCGIRCNDARFRDFLSVEYGFDTEDAEQAAVVSRQICGVESRAEFATNAKARAKWQSLDDQYREWAHL